MRRSSLFRNKQRGATLFLFIVIVLILLPAVFLMLQRSIFQNRRSLRDRNIKTSREMAESIGTDFMNSFSSDWHRDAFDSLYTTHNNPTYVNLGKAVSTLTKDRSFGTIRIQTVATYDKGGRLPEKDQVVRGVDALYTWVSDSLKFDYVWNNSVSLGVSLDQAFDQANLGQLNNTVFVRGDFDTGTSSFSFKIGGFWVVKGTFTLRSPAQLDNALVHCYAFNNVGSAAVVGTTIRVLPPENFFPHFEIIPPEGGGVPGSLEYYDTRNTVDRTIPLNAGLNLELHANDTYTLTPLDSSLVPNGAPVTTGFFSGPVTSTAPFSMVFNGTGTVVLSTSVISRPITVVIRGGEGRVIGNVSYSGGIVSATINKNFSFLSEGSITFAAPNAQSLVGFYGTPLGTLRFVGDQNVTLTGTLSGVVGTYASPWGTMLNVTADPGLCQYPPPLFPRRPRIIMWDYVP